MRTTEYVKKLNFEQVHWGYEPREPGRDGETLGPDAPWGQASPEPEPRVNFSASLTYCVESAGAAPKWGLALFNTAVGWAPLAQVSRAKSVESAVRGIRSMMEDLPAEANALLDHILADNSQVPVEGADERN